MINMKEYIARRRELMRLVGQTGAVIIPSAAEVLRNGDAMYPFRQNSDFYYLTGFEEPESVLVLLPKRKEGEFILFNRVRDREHEIWDGPRAGQDGARQQFGANQAFPIAEFEQRLPALLAGRESIHSPIGLNKEFDKTLMRAINQMRAKIRRGTQSPLAFLDIAPSIHEMRLIKSPAEIQLMRQAIEITAKGHIRAMQACKPGMSESQLEAELNYEFHKNGARFSAYNAIVGAGKNACVLHYTNNNQLIKNGDLVLIDAGAEYQNYAADITRTFPANGRFSAEQRAIYELVLTAQLAAIKSVKPGSSWTTAQTTILKVLTQGLVDLGILKGKLDDLLEKKAYLPFYMHGSGHWLGLDVHDVGRYAIEEGRWRKLEAGMVLTIEPGLYLSAEIPGLHKRWHNIGVRIEDDVLVTKEGRDVLSQQIPKRIDEIEALMAE